jgi:broad specificity phosphatase PhoE
MHADLILICHASTAAVRSASFPADEPLDDRGTADAAKAAATIHPADRVWCAPSLAARQTASALGLDATVNDAIREWDFGGWAGRSLADVARDEPAAFSAWVADPPSAPPGGEHLADLLHRVGAWVGDSPSASGTTIAVTHSSVIRAAIVHAIEASTASFWHLDVRPLSQTWLRANGTRWNLRSLKP